MFVLRSKYRLVILRELIVALMYILRETRAGQQKKVFESGRAGVREGRTSHISDTISSAKNARNCVQESTVQKC